MPLGTIERALQLASTGRSQITDLIRTLSREGYSDAKQQLDGFAIRKKIKELAAAAKAPTNKARADTLLQKNAPPE